MTTRSEQDRIIVARAREVAGVKDTAAWRVRYGEADGEMARAAALGEAQFLLLALAEIAERSIDETEDSRRLAAIRDILRHFDWEHHDRQLALEAIERITEGGNDGG